ncbi:MAG: RNA 2',3'-cyclic phosphodiesterase [Candidatus Staskawiczbacteria bacterium]|nr:RNA 2',3'-cyclic phosphodiesterase [Candidatus Staskawiczbacteria bacterium]
MEKRHRVFVAINLPHEIRKELFEYSEKHLDLPAKWTAKDNLHITLEFLGALTDEEAGEVCLAVKEVAERHSSFSLNLNKILYGPPNLKAGQAPKFVWAEGDKSEELSALREDLENSLAEKVAFVPENRVFAPHITLARISSWEWKAIEPEERPEINENLDLLFTVESIEVMESEKRKDGQVYTVLESHQLNN